MAFDWKKPTAQMLGRWQPWHKGHTNLFKKALEQTGQVAIMVRDVGGIIGQDAGGGRTVKQDDNPFDFNFVFLPKLDDQLKQQEKKIQIMCLALLYSI